MSVGLNILICLSEMALCLWIMDSVRCPQTILYIKAKFQFTGCNDFYLCEHSSKLLVLLLSSQTNTDDYKSLGDTAVLILHFLFRIQEHII